MGWTSLFIAGILEIGWPIGFKLGWIEDGTRPLWILFPVGCMAASGLLLLVAQRTIPMGTAYAFWTGIGPVGAFTVGIIVFGDASSIARFISISLIVAGIVGLKMA